MPVFVMHTELGLGVAYGGGVARGRGRMEKADDGNEMQ